MPPPDSARFDGRPDWRWRAALCYGPTEKWPVEARRDRYLRLALRYAQRLAATDGGLAAIADLSHHFRYLAQAHQVRSADPETSEFVEALVMARCPPAEICAVCPALTPHALAVYEAVFFDVRRRLGLRAWVATILLKDLQEPGGHPTSGTLLKALALVGGKELLVTFLDDRAEPGSAQWSLLERITSDQLLRATVQRVATMDSTPENLVSLLGLTEDLSEGVSLGAKHDEERYEQLVRRMIEQVRDSVGDRIVMDQPPGSGPQALPSYREAVARRLVHSIRSRSGRG